MSNFNERYFIFEEWVDDDGGGMIQEEHRDVEQVRRSLAKRIAGLPVELVKSELDDIVIIKGTRLVCSVKDVVKEARIEIG